MERLLLARPRRYDDRAARRAVADGGVCAAKTLGDVMDDLEMTKLCAHAMGIVVEVCNYAGGREFLVITESAYRYNPLHDDEQAMALVKKMNLYISPPGVNQYAPQGWFARSRKTSKNGVRGGGVMGFSQDINRAICLCVAQMEAAKHGS